MRIHHATAKRAESLGIQLELSDDGEAIVATRGKTVLATGDDGKTVLAEAEARLNGTLDASEGDDEDQDDDEGSEVEGDPEERADDDAEGDEAGSFKGSIVKPKYRRQYQPMGDCCGDDLAQEMKEYLTVTEDGESRLDVQLLRRFAEANECWVDKYRSLNPGQIRMNVGNRLRAKMKKGWDVQWVK